MIDTKLADTLNQQMNYEFEAAHAYMAKAAYCEQNNYGGFAHFYLQQAEEERFHGMKIYHYLNNRGIHAKFTMLAEPRTDFDGILDTFEYSLQQEQKVTKQFYNLADIALDTKEHATISFLGWFLDEQVEEEASFETHIEYLKRIGGDKKSLFMYEKELAQRNFVPSE